MKRLIMLAVLCAFVLSAAAASAADLKASGDWVVEAVWAANWDFGDGSSAAKDADESNFDVHQRLTTQFEFIANENLKGVLVTRYGTEQWGTRSFALGAGDSGTNDATTNRIAVRRAYIDFVYPDTTVKVRAGYQAISLPASIGGGSYILDEEVGAAVVSGSITDNVGYMAGYVRATQDESDSDSALDAFIVGLPMTFDGFSIQPFGVYAPLANGVQVADVTAGMKAVNATTVAGDGDFDNAYWLGAAFSMNLFDPFVVKGDLNYGKVASDKEYNERSGWLFDVAVEYKGLDFMTPEAFFVYTSGEDGNSTQGGGSSERMPFLAAQNWAVGSFFFGGDRLLSGSMANLDQSLGFYALGVNLKDIQSFAAGLTHDATIMYVKGTNDSDVVDGQTGIAYGRTLTDKDSLVEIDFNTGYKLYDELTLSLDLGYINLDADSDVWGSGNTGGDAWKVSTGIAYSF